MRFALHLTHTPLFYVIRFVILMFARSAFTPNVDNTETLHMLLSAARLLQLLSSASAALCPTTRRSLPASPQLNSAFKLSHENASSSADSSSSDEASMQVPQRHLAAFHWHSLQYRRSLPRSF